MSATGGAVTAPGTAVAASANVANAAATATLAATPGKTNYVAGIEITAGGATAAAIVNATLTGVVGGPLNYAFAAPAGANLEATPLILEFNPPLPATGLNVAAVLNLPALGAGNTNAAVTVHGYVA